MYRIVRFYQRERPNGSRRVVKATVAKLEQAQAHCQNPETSSSTCTSLQGKRHTERYGPWFDGYEEVK